MNDYMTRRELADMLRLRVNTLASSRFRLTGPRYYRVTGKAVRYLRSEVAAWLAAREAPVLPA